MPGKILLDHQIALSRSAVCGVFYTQTILAAGLSSYPEIGSRYDGLSTRR
jgi:hypothetical protein